MPDKFISLLERYSAPLTAVISFIIYLFTIAPGVIQIDSGELAAVQSTLGIAHPTGYPLFTITGYLFLLLPLPFTKIFSANLLAAIWCSAGIGFFVKTVQMLLTNILTELAAEKKSKNKKQKIVETAAPVSSIVILISSITAGFILALNKTYWMQSNSVEVYSLQAFLFSLILFASIKIYYSKEDKLNDWIYAALFFALGFSNHMTTFLIIPFIAILFFNKEKFNLRSLKKIGTGLLVFIPVLILFYSYLPLRASANPAINWGSPVNWENIFRHVSGRQYQVWLFVSADSAKRQLIYFLENLPAEFSYLSLLFAAVGSFQLFKLSKKMFWTLLVTFVFAAGYSINYDIVDIDSYFLLPYMIVSIFAALGIYKIADYLHLKSANLVQLFSVPIIFVITPIVVTSGKVDQSGQFTFEDYTKSLINSTEKNSIIFSYQWDYFVSSSYYFQHVENFRKDVTVIDKELLRRSWYYNQIKTNHSEVIEKLEPDINNFLNALKPFERDEKFDPDLLEKYYRTIMTKLISENYPQRNYYIGFELVQNEMQRGEFSLPEGLQLIPHLFLYKVVSGNDYAEAPLPNFTIRFPKERGKYANFIYTVVGNMLAERAAYELRFNKIDRAKIYLEKIKKDLPEYQIPAQLAQIVN
ncbi:MAG: DUF2723 domain-containing protein [Ignavibacteriales bacterium]|nr:DUF2723 domain-containing protein [Ignavibacteriales bacterium]